MKVVLNVKIKLYVKYMVSLRCILKVKEGEEAELLGDDF